jgi:hypothetical protein
MSCQRDRNTYNYICRKHPHRKARNDRAAPDPELARCAPLHTTQNGERESFWIHTKRDLFRVFIDHILDAHVVRIFRQCYWFEVGEEVRRNTAGDERDDTDTQRCEFETPAFACCNQSGFGGLVVC